MGAPIVVAFGILAAVLCFFVPTYGAAFLAVGLSLAVAAVFSAFQSILLKIEDLERKIEQNLVSFNDEESREFVDAVEASYKRPEVPAQPPTAVPAPATPMTVSTNEPPPVVTKAFEAPLPPPPKPMEQFEKTLDHSSPPVTIQQPVPPPVSLETTQSFLPNQPRLGTVSPQENLNPAETIGFGAAPAGFSKNPSDPGVQIPPPLPASLTGIEEPKPRKAGRRRYSTFAGLSLAADSGPLRTVEHISPAQEAVKNLGTMAPPPPPKKPREKEKRRYSTFAGLSLSDRGGQARPIPPPPPAPPPFSIPGRLEPPQPKGEFAEYFQPSPNDPPMSSSGNFEEYFRPAPGEAGYTPQSTPPSSDLGQKESRKRYQTFMGLSLSKTPPAMKRLPSPEEVSGTAPLPPSYEQSYRPTPQKGTQINKGQVGSLVDGFCSLCGSPQAAGKNLEDTLSTPEFCWYCGAKLTF